MGGISFSQQEYDKILRVVEMMQEDFLSESKIFQNRMQEIVLESKNKRFSYGLTVWPASDRSYKH